MVISVHRLGIMGYGQALSLQRSLVAQRRANAIPDTLLLLQHPAVFTLGRLQASRQNVLASETVIAAAGATIEKSDRGGNVTFHGPGQLVAYPILDLNGFKRDLRWYVSSLEQVLIQTAAEFCVCARAGESGETGVW
eukprot:CAMPEP_0119318656 /NCGR_PEP_ID=MMETSP1333-20130426/47059_1 /TAXON_ID=418940 /ORGANISM="Scyphosphaera apsteinii, Strain RCC1455" /LENGTH=136 /DNA_ID=CAMNT_0007324885 /DNA_START=11 /DNA_END=418 /DNA_ORIENTATION=+